MAMFQAHDLSMELPGGRWLFKDINIKLEEGEICTISGPSGCGKTTLLKCIAELIPYHSGYSTLFDKSVTDYTVPVWRSRAMYVPQRASVHPGTPLDLFAMVQKYGSQKNKKFDNPVEIGCQWNLSESHFSEKWSNLSGGEMQRVYLAIAVALNPDVLLLDEPTSALDPESVELVEKYLKKNKTCIWITHDPKQQERVGNQHLTMENSQLSTPAASSENSSATVSMYHSDYYN